jgi:dCMP deaminase
MPKHDYYLMLAQATAYRSNCTGLDVGAVIVKGDRILATGYNGTASGMPNCLDHGCLRCSDREQFESGKGYDLCSCVHAEANAIATAARFGHSLDGATLYCTDQPCFGCSKELIQAGIIKVYFLHEWKPDDRVRDDYMRLQGKLSSERLKRRVPERCPLCTTPKERRHCPCPSCVRQRTTFDPLSGVSPN